MLVCSVPISLTYSNFYAAAVSPEAGTRWHFQESSFLFFFPPHLNDCDASGHNVTHTPWFTHKPTYSTYKYPFFLILHSIYSSYYISPYSSLYDRFTSFSSFRSLLIMQPKTSNYTPLLTHSTADRRMSPSRDISSFSFWLCGEEEEKKEKEKHLLHITYVKKKKKNTRVLSRPGA